MNITTVGIDLAKLVFQVHGIDARGKVTLRKQLKRSQVVPFFAQLSPCLIGMEACGGAHFWARRLVEFGHTVKLIAPQFVKPYVKTNKNDAAVVRSEDDNPGFAVGTPIAGRPPHRSERARFRHSAPTLGV
jgi:transposase